MARVIWSPNARRSARVAYDHIARDSVLNAERWFERVRAAAEMLETFPEIGSPVEDGDIEGLREQIIGSHRLVYRFDGFDCHIVTVVRADRDLRRAIGPEDLA